MNKHFGIFLIHWVSETFEKMFKMKLLSTFQLVTRKLTYYSPTNANFVRIRS